MQVTDLASNSYLQFVHFMDTTFPLPPHDTTDDFQRMTLFVMFCLLALRILILFFQTLFLIQRSIIRILPYLLVGVYCAHVRPESMFECTLFLITNYGLVYSNFLCPILLGVLVYIKLYMTRNTPSHPIFLWLPIITGILTGELTQLILNAVRRFNNTFYGFSIGMATEVERFALRLSEKMLCKTRMADNIHVNVNVKDNHHSFYNTPTPLRRPPSPVPLVCPVAIRPPAPYSFKYNTPEITVIRRQLFKTS